MLIQASLQLVMRTVYEGDAWSVLQSEPIFFDV